MVILVVLLRTIYDSDPATPETPCVILVDRIRLSSKMGYEGWDYRAADGATVSGTRAVADGSTNLR